MVEHVPCGTKSMLNLIFRICNIFGILQELSSERLVFLAGPFKFLFNFNYNTFFLHYIESTGQATADRVVKHGNQCP